MMTIKYPISIINLRELERETLNGLTDFYVKYLFKKFHVFLDSKTATRIQHWSRHLFKKAARVCTNTLYMGTLLGHYCERRVKIPHTGLFSHYFLLLFFMNTLWKQWTFDFIKKTPAINVAFSFMDIFQAMHSALKAKILAKTGCLSQ